jgi:hypothetical protein
MLRSTAPTKHIRLSTHRAPAVRTSDFAERTRPHPMRFQEPIALRQYVAAAKDGHLRQRRFARVTADGGRVVGAHQESVEWLLQCRQSFGSLGPRQHPMPPRSDL